MQGVFRPSSRIHHSAHAVFVTATCCPCDWNKWWNIYQESGLTDHHLSHVLVTKDSVSHPAPLLNVFPFFRAACLSHITCTYTDSLSLNCPSQLPGVFSICSLPLFLCLTSDKSLSTPPLLHCFPMYPHFCYARTITLSLVKHTVSLSCFPNSTPSLLLYFPSVFPFSLSVTQPPSLNLAHPFSLSLCIVYVSHTHSFFPPSHPTALSQSLIFPPSLSLSHTHTHMKCSWHHSTVLNLLNVIIAHILIDSDDVVLFLLPLVSDVVLTPLLVLGPLLHLPLSWSVGTAILLLLLLRHRLFLSLLLAAESCNHRITPSLRQHTDNPFTVAACTIFEMKGARMCLQTSSSTSTVNAFN